MTHQVPGTANGATLHPPAASASQAPSSQGATAPPAGSPAAAAAAAHVAVRPDPTANHQPAMATKNPTTGGWMAHRSENGQVQIPLLWLHCLPNDIAQPRKASNVVSLLSTSSACIV